MSQTTPLTGHAIFPSFTATATLQKRLGSDVVADPPPALTWLEIWNPVALVEGRPSAFFGSR